MLGIISGTRMVAGTSTAVENSHNTSRLAGLGSQVGLISLLTCRMNDDPLSPILDQLYPGARVHHGFLDQFQAVTDKAANATENIRHAAWPPMLGLTASDPIPVPEGYRGSPLAGHCYTVASAKFESGCERRGGY